MSSLCLEKVDKKQDDAYCRNCHEGNNSKEVRILNGLVKELSPTSTSDTHEYKQFPVI